LSFCVSLSHQKKFVWIQIKVQRRFHWDFGCQVWSLCRFADLDNIKTRITCEWNLSKIFTHRERNRSRKLCKSQVRNLECHYEIWSKEFELAFQRCAARRAYKKSISPEDFSDAFCHSIYCLKCKTVIIYKHFELKNETKTADIEFNDLLVLLKNLINFQFKFHMQ
jgi:hypothetical protein